MKNHGLYASRHGLEAAGLAGVADVYWNLPPAQLYEHTIRRGEAMLAAEGPLVARTGAHTGRSPNDRFLVRNPEATSAANIWWGDVNREFAPASFAALHKEVCSYLEGREVFVFDGYAGADPEYRLKVRIVNEVAWHNLFARNMFVREANGPTLEGHAPEFTVISAPGFEADPALHGTTSGTFILVDLEKRLVLIGGSSYAGEIKKSIFSVMNYLLPERGVLPMHCSCNYGPDGDTALFFGLSGTGKTTLSADSERTLVGDDEHGWSDRGVFNMEGGCYAKVIRLSPSGEPEIYATTRRFGTILENVVIDPANRRIDLDDGAHTENTRASYPLTQLARADLDGLAGHPNHVVFLTCDAFGVLPPISRLSEDQAAYHFLSGYTAKVAGTERGVTDPKATFSACFGAPFMPRHPGVYARMLAEKIRQHDARVWLVNTGWTGGSFGVGQRMALSHTRRMVRAALAGELEEVGYAADPFFGLEVPVRVSGVPDEILRPRSAWADAAAYDDRAGKLAEMFSENFSGFEEGVGERVRVAGPSPMRV
ncbi:MAG: phosphoenolpyruvate carboxykinase (ATP) [Acidobacteriota bacterium]|nr:phosphoenolpyruvate carboxykinase (ATP) [Acidobacteriota bacterium]